MFFARPTLVFHRMASMLFSLLLASAAIAQPTTRVVFPVGLADCCTGPCWPVGLPGGVLVYHGLQEALDDSVPGDIVKITQGEWYPSPPMGTPPTDRCLASFRVPIGVTIIGGYCGDEGPSDPPDGTLPTTLSGNIGNVSDATDNAMHVITFVEPAVDPNYPDWCERPLSQRETVFQNLTIAHGFAEGNNCLTRPEGGGVFVEDPTLGSTFPLGRAFVFRNCRFTSNHAANSGGAIYMSSQQLVIENCVFENNTANSSSLGPPSAGGAISCAGDCVSFPLEGCEVSSISITDSVFTSNSSRIGGAVYIGGTNRSTGNAFIMIARGCEFIQNQTTDSLGNPTGGHAGGAINVNLRTDVHLIDCLFQGNRSSGIGGGAFVSSGCPVQAVRCRFLDNVTTGISGNGGGAAYILHRIIGGPISFDSCVFAGNAARDGRNGGAVYLSTEDETGRCRFFNCLFHDNESGTRDDSNPNDRRSAAGRGGALLIEGGIKLDIINCTLSKNRAWNLVYDNSGIQAGDGGAIYMQQTSYLPELRVLNTIIWDNCAIAENQTWGQYGCSGSPYDSISQPVGASFPITSCSSVMPNNVVMSGYLPEDPLFEDPNHPMIHSRNFRLRYGPNEQTPIISPCIDRGANHHVIGDVYDEDGDDCGDLVYGNGMPETPEGEPCVEPAPAPTNGERWPLDLDENARFINIERVFWDDPVPIGAESDYCNGPDCAPGADAKCCYRVVDIGCYEVQLVPGDVYCECAPRCPYNISCCPCDLNTDGLINSQDFFDFLNNYFYAGVDYNCDNIVDSQDFFDFLSCQKACAD